LIYEVILYSDSIQGVIVLVDESTGEIVGKTFPSPGYVNTRASVPHEAYTDGQTKNFHGLPYVDLHLSTEYRDMVYRGASDSFYAQTSASGYYPGSLTLAYIDAAGNQTGYDTLQGNTIHQSFCNPVALKACGYFGAGSWKTCETAECNNYALQSYYFLSTSYNGVHNTSWYPTDDPSRFCDASNITYRQYVGSSSRQGRRKEILFHAGRAKRYWSDWLGVSLNDATVDVITSFDIDANQNNIWSRSCDSGLSDSATHFTITCNICSFEQRLGILSAEQRSRGVVHHEYGHFVDRNIHTGGSSAWSIDTPRVNYYAGGSLTEAIAMWNSLMLSNFEREEPATTGSRLRACFRYPDGYECGTGGSDLYRLTFPWTNTWSDFTLLGGPSAIQTMAWHISDSRFHNSRLLDPSCVNTFNYDSCPAGRYSGTYYKILFDANTPWNGNYKLTYEATLSWQNRITDWDTGSPGNGAVQIDGTIVNECRPGTPQAGQVLCNGWNVPMTNCDPDSDYSPWFDDVTNVSWYSSSIPTDLQGVYGSGVYHLGPFSSAPVTCTSTDSTALCKPLATDYGDDYDKFVIIAKANESYRIYLMPGVGYDVNSNPRLDIRNSSDGIIASNDNCVDTSFPVMPSGPRGTNFPCVVLTPSTTGIYRVAVSPSPGSIGGSKVRYVLHVDMVNDDIGDSPAASTPVAQGFNWTAKLGVNDIDVYHQVLTSPGDIALWAGPTNSQLPISVELKDQNGEPLLNAPCINSLNTWTFNNKSAGVYFLTIKTCGGVAADYWLYLSNTAVLGSTQETAFNVDSAGYQWPLPTKAITSSITCSNCVQYYRLWAEKGEIMVHDAFAQEGAVSISIEPDKRMASGATASYDKLYRSDWSTGGCGGLDEVPSGRGCENNGGTCYLHETLLDDLYGGIVRDGMGKANSHVSFVAPWQGYYFVKVTSRTNLARYVLYSAAGLVWTDYPQEY
jgi:hypothetical protein